MGLLCRYVDDFILMLKVMVGFWFYEFWLDEEIDFLFFKVYILDIEGFFLILFVEFDILMVF